MYNFKHSSGSLILVSAWLTAYAQPGVRLPSATIEPDRASVAKQVGKLPLRFEANQGQVPSNADFVARGPGYDMVLDATGASLRLRHLRVPLRDQETLSATQASLRMQLVGAGQPSKVEALDPIETLTSYFIGNDPAKWRTGIRNYGSVWYRGVYPGVDLNYHGTQGQLEYDFVLGPGADANGIVLQFDGIAALNIGRDGDLILHVADGEIRQQPPVFYQQNDSSRTPVSGRYKLLGSNRVGFDVAGYNHSRPLVIGPTLSYSTYVGGNGWDEGVGIALDGAGNAYVAGWTTSTNFPVTAGAEQTVQAGGGTFGDAFVFKLNSSGTGMVYCTYLGGSSDDVGWMIALDSGGDAYVTGYTSSTDFPTTTGAFQRILPGSSAAFVSKLNPTGTSLVYSTYLGGNATDKGLGLAVDATGAAYVAGRTTSTNFPTTSGAFQTANAGADDVFVAKVAANGSALVYSTLIGGAGTDLANGIAVDSSGSAYVSGYTQSAGFPVTAGAFQTVFAGNLGDAFVTKLNLTGTALVYSTFLGGNGDEYVRSIALDSSGNAYVAGKTASTNFPVTAGAFQTVYHGSFDGFVSKLNTSGTALVYSTYLGGSGTEQFESIAVDSTGAAHVVGLSTSTDYPVSSDALQSALRGAQNSVLSKLNANGTGLLFSTYFGGSGGTDTSIFVATDSSNASYMMGFTNSVDLFATVGAFNRTFSGGTGDVFVAKVNYSVSCSYSLSPTSQSVAAAGGNAGTNVTTGAGCPWTATSDVPWVTVTSGSFGVGNGSIVLAVAANTGLARSGNVTVKGQTFTVNQAASAGGFTVIRVNAGGPAYTDPQGQVWSADTGFSGGFTFGNSNTISNTTTPALYQNERAAAATFQYQFTVPNGTYNVKLKFAEIYFTQTGQRSFNVVINGQQVLTSFDVVAAAGGANTAVDKAFPIPVTAGQITIQFVPVVSTPAINAIEIVGLSNVAVTVNPANVALPPNGQQTFTATVTGSANQAVNWTLSGPGTLAGNTYTAPSTVTVGQTATVTASSQADGNASGTGIVGLVAGCTYSINPASQSYNSTGGSGSVTVTAAAGCSWTASSNVAWMTITSGASGSGNGTVNYTVASTTTGRSGTVTIAGQTFTVNQTGPGLTTIRVNAGGAAYTDPLGQVWSADTGFSGGFTFGNSNTISNTTTPQLYQDERAAGATFQYQFAVPNGTYNVKLKFAEIFFTQAGQRSFNVVVNGQQVLTNFDVVAAAGGANTAVDKVFPIPVTAGQITIQFVPVVSSPTISAIEIVGLSNVAVTVSPANVSLPPNAQQIFTAAVTGSSNQAVNWTLSGPGSLVGNTYTAPATVTAGQTATVTATSQADANAVGTGIAGFVPGCTYSINPVSQSYNSTGGTGSVTVTAAAGCSWTATSNAAWITITSGASGSGNGTVNYTVASTTAARSGTMTIAGQTFTVTQTAPGFTPIRVNAGGVAYTDPLGQVWSADTGFSGGFTYGNGNTISNTTTPQLYQDERAAAATFQYQFAVPNGTYNVKLKFAEIYFTQTGQRSFNVVINGQQVLTSFDVVAAAGGANTAVDKVFVTAVTTGQVNIQFVPVVSTPTINAIEIQ